MSALPHIVRIYNMPPVEQAKVVEAFRRAGIPLRMRTRLVVDGEPTADLATALRTMGPDDMQRDFRTRKQSVSQRTCTGLSPRPPKTPTSAADFMAIGKATVKRKRKAEQARKRGGA